MYDLQYRLRRIRAFLWKNPELVTRTLIAINVLTFLVYFVSTFFVRAGNPWRWLDFSTIESWREPWTFLTYPLVTYDPLSLLFGGYWLWIVGGTLERSWKSRAFLCFFFCVALATSLGLWAGNRLLEIVGLGILNVHAFLNGLWMPLAGLTVSWCLLNPDQVVLFGFVLPIKGRHLMWVTIALTYFLFAMGYSAPYLAFFALSGIGFAYFYTRRRLARYTYDFYRYKYKYKYPPRPPTVLERMFDWLAFHWERFRRRWRG